VTLALNMFTQGVDPALDVSDINGLVRVFEYCNQLPVHPRHPYAGELVFTAFSGSHQDAINKGLKALQKSNTGVWEVPYLPIDPADVGRSYEAVIRINSQSGKGGIAYVLEKDYGLALPRRLQIEFSKIVQGIADAEGTELTGARIHEALKAEYLDQAGPYAVIEHRTVPDPDPRHQGERLLTATVIANGERREIEGRGTGPIDAFVDAFNRLSGLSIEVVDYREHATGSGAGATAVAYVEVKTAAGASLFGIGMHKNITTASLRAVVSAANRASRAAAA
jgi:2-isopropylmalate synthase